ncbi:hypothetical protein DFH09DRAFT_1071648 [Mycena vulgaris]|nr:hypothetical protein DFH09DRAFT_1071648 [Mycena vulgaris]
MAAFIQRLQEGGIEIRRSERVNSTPACTARSKTEGRAPAAAGKDVDSKPKASQTEQAGTRQSDLQEVDGEFEGAEHSGLHRGRTPVLDPMTKSHAALAASKILRCMSAMTKLEANIDAAILRQSVQLQTKVSSSPGPCVGCGAHVAVASSLLDQLSLAIRTKDGHGYTRGYLRAYPYPDPQKPLLDNLNTFISRAICVVLGPNALALFWAACCDQVVYPKQVAASPRSQTKQAAERGGGNAVAGSVAATRKVESRLGKMTRFKV